MHMPTGGRVQGDQGVQNMSLYIKCPLLAHGLPRLRVVLGLGGTFALSPQHAGLVVGPRKAVRFLLLGREPTEGQGQERRLGT